jgi:acylphosphatase
MKKVKILVTGRVQGVFFRVYTRNYARELQDVTGYVKNLPDGRVEILAEGPEDSLKKMIHWVKMGGSPASNVTKTEEFWENNDLKRTFKSFDITY